MLGSCVTYSRPVYIEFPRDLVDAPCEPVPKLPAPGYSREALSDSSTKCSSASSVHARR